MGMGFNTIPRIHHCDG